MCACACGGWGLNSVTMLPTFIFQISKFNEFQTGLTDGTLNKDVPAGGNTVHSPHPGFSVCLAAIASD